MDRYVEANRRLWDEWTHVHESSAFYNLDSFKKGTTKDRPFDAGPGVRIRDYEAQEIGDVANKELLHLQCHFGIDTLSWARLGASVTGVDFSVEAVDLARRLAAEIGVEASFVVSSIQEARENISGEFDIVYTSRGAIWWLHDLEEWARTIAHFLRPGGVFYITEFHPILQTLAEIDELRIDYPYFPRKEPMEFPVGGSYADRDAIVEAEVEYGWPHPISEIVSAIAGAGLRIEFLHEFDWVDYQQIPLLHEEPDGKWRLPLSVEGELPLMFSIRATKD